MNYIKITKENVDKEHICCAMSGQAKRYEKRMNERAFWRWRPSCNKENRQAESNQKRGALCKVLPFFV